MSLSHYSSKESLRTYATKFYANAAVRVNQDEGAAVRRNFLQKRREIIGPA